MENSEQKHNDETVVPFDVFKKKSEEAEMLRKMDETAKAELIAKLNLPLDTTDENIIEAELSESKIRLDEQNRDFLRNNVHDNLGGEGNYN